MGNSHHWFTTIDSHFIYYENEEDRFILETKEAKNILKSV